MPKTKIYFVWQCWRFQFLGKLAPEVFLGLVGRMVNFSRKHMTELCCCTGFKPGIKKTTITKPTILKRQLSTFSFKGTPLKT